MDYPLQGLLALVFFAPWLLFTALQVFEGVAS